MELKEALGVDIVGPHEADAKMLANLEVQAERFGLGGTVRNCTPDRFLEEGETVSFGDHVFEVLHCPGHAPGHVVYFNRAARFAHVGDVLFRGSVGRTDLPGGDHAALIRSIKEKLLAARRRRRLHLRPRPRQPLRRRAARQSVPGLSRGSWTEVALAARSGCRCPAGNGL